MLETLVFLAAILPQAQADDLAAQLRELDSKVLPAEQPRMISRDAHARIEAANRRESEAWGKITTREQWEAYRDSRVTALRESLGAKETAPQDLKVRVTKTLEGQGHRIENLVFESRPGLLVTANLYVPVPERASMPGILIIHSHHNPKTQSELQDMGVMWSRLGCLVLVMDQVGHGERRQHPFVDASSYPGPYKVSRQDYFFRYVTGLQLQLAGESLIGWMAWDLSRGVDLLLARPGIDKNRIILLGSVAGGGDPAGVTAALDPRITAAAPFNFGGPQPETVYPLPENAETTFNYAGGGSWESTRNLNLSARDGFLPWVIVGSLAPRKLIYGHEFSWDRDHDPVWKRLEKIYGFYDAGLGLSAATGRGNLKGQPPEATHCNNIGPVHRQGIYAALKKWYEIPEPEKESQDRRPSAELLCLTTEIKPRLVHELAQERARNAPPALLRDHWRSILGGIEAQADARISTAESRKAGDIAIDRITLEVEPGIVVPLLLLLPPHEANAKLPVVVGVAQGGKQGFLKNRSGDIAVLLKGGAAVCLPDLRGTGETRPGDGRGRGSESTSVASSEFMLGRNLVGLRVRDLRTVLRHLRGRTDLDPKRVALWGDSFAPPNPPERRFDVPIDADKVPDLAEPLGGLAALFGALFEEDVRAVLIRGGLSSYRSLLDSPFCYVPLDAIVPGGAKGTDLTGVAAALAPRALRCEELVDGWNRRVPMEALLKIYTPAVLETEGSSAAWLLKQIKN
jgi:cephalosporin-C deacetylase-like acetyl esterase